MSDMAVRHPKRGKAHRKTTDAYTSTLYVDATVCGRWARDMTERIAVERTDPADRCKRCWPTTTRGEQSAETNESGDQ